MPVLHAVMLSLKKIVLYAKLLINAGITSKELKNDANCLNINVVTVTNDDKTEKCKTQRKAEYRKRTVFKSLPKKR